MTRIVDATAAEMSFCQTRSSRRMSLPPSAHSLEDVGEAPRKCASGDASTPAPPGAGEAVRETW